MSSDIVNHLYKKFYGGQTNRDSAQASAHWKIFSKHFQVVAGEDGSIQTIRGYGFGGSDDDRLSARMMAAVGNALIVSQLHYPGLSTYIREAKKTVNTMGLFFSQDALRQACTCFFLRQQLSKNNVSVKNILIIGDGHGILAALMSEQFPNAKIFLIDLGATLFFQAYYLDKIFPAKQHRLAGYSADMSIDSGFIYCAAEEITHLPFEETDLAINVASMQEMTMKTVRDYFTLLRQRSTKLFYCCNRLEKKLPDGELIRFMEYPWKKEDIYWVDEKCAWHQFFFGRSGAAHIKLFGLVPVPLLHRYDGRHWHRLTLLSHQS